MPTCGIGTHRRTNSHEPPHFGAGCIAVSVGYRLAPEHPFPVALHDCAAVCEWASEHGADVGEYGLVAVGGVSSGGNLAAAVALTAAQRGRPRLAHQVLAVPVLDARMASPSWQRNGAGYLLTRETTQWYHRGDVSVAAGVADAGALEVDGRLVLRSSKGAGLPLAMSLEQADSHGRRVPPCRSYCSRGLRAMRGKNALCAGWPVPGTLPVTGFSAPGSWWPAGTGCGCRQSRPDWCRGPSRPHPAGRLMDTGSKRRWTTLAALKDLGIRKSAHRRGDCGDHDRPVPQQPLLPAVFRHDRGRRSWSPPDLRHHRQLIQPEQLRHPEWLAGHPRIRQVFIPVGACRPNLQEAWWRIFRRHAIAGQCFIGPDDIDYATRIATAQLNAQANPWVWGRPHRHNGSYADGPLHL
ncbi:alpha/beta hydrolase fold domain-containing protein [Nonomuraea sp. NPDC049695]|uniref:alpha/beta hydrolase fold domain-containing protein n=1 Tax=Nonomuraea sp. NPDC049695 TaxID=3154734 RepID=UPI003432D120